MKKITYLVALLIISACQKEENPNTIPAYLKIDTITLDENNTTTNITDAWVYVDDQLQGVYELPATFPVLETDSQTLRIKAGIKSNGIASSRIAYPFYASFIDTVLFTPNQTITVNPTVSYLDSLDFFLVSINISIFHQYYIYLVLYKYRQLLSVSYSHYSE